MFEIVDGQTTDRRQRIDAGGSGELNSFLLLAVPFYYLQITNYYGFAANCQGHKQNHEAFQ